MIDEKIIVLGLSPTAKYVGKEAYNSTIKCLAFDFKKGAGYYSKYFEKTEVISDVLLLEKLKNKFLNNGVNYYVCPTSDEWIAFIYNNKEIFTGTNLKTNLSYLDNTYNLLADKFELLKTSNTVNLNYPKSILFTPGKDSLPDLTDLDFPIFVKPSNRTGLAHIMQGKKGWLFNSKDEWSNFYVLKRLTDVELLIQEVIIGEESNIKVLGTIANNGTKDQCWIGIKHRQYPYGFGSATLVVETVDEELEEITDKLLKETKYSGFFALETKYCDKRKKTYIIEVNTRPGLWFGATTTSSCNFVIKWMNDLRENKEKLNLPVFSKSKEKVVWRYFYKDLYVKLKTPNLKEIKTKELENVKNSYAVYDINDMKPFFFDLFSGLKKVIGLKV
jgi:predicted ATP-grasp superfamily ATP-dependent carboligase